MLILSRRITESILIGEDIEIIVLRVQGGQVKIGVKAPRTLTIYRDEVHKRIQSERKPDTFQTADRRDTTPPPAADGWRIDGVGEVLRSNVPKSK